MKNKLDSLDTNAGQPTLFILCLEQLSFIRIYFLNDNALFKGDVYICSRFLSPAMTPFTPAAVEITFSRWQ